MFFLKGNEPLPDDTQPQQQGGEPKLHDSNSSPQDFTSTTVTTATTIRAVASGNQGLNPPSPGQETVVRNGRLTAVAPKSHKMALHS